jgi:hypothetical protein
MMLSIAIIYVLFSIWAFYEVRRAHRLEGVWYGYTFSVEDFLSCTTPIINIYVAICLFLIRKPKYDFFNFFK